MLLATALLTVGLLALGTTSTAAAQAPVMTAEELVAGDWTELKKGLRYVDMVEGEGKPVKSGRQVAVQYTGFLLDGTKFDSSYDSGSSLSFKLGAGQVVTGWEKGIVGMMKGGTRRLYIPSKLAYGRNGVKHPRTGEYRIPPHSDLVFIIELVSFR